jgi:hypothetical protein
MTEPREGYVPVIPDALQEEEFIPILIVDPDGWRMKDAPAWTEPITEQEFGWRAAMSTQRTLGHERARR